MCTLRNFYRNQVTNSRISAEMYAIVFFGNVPAFWPAWKHFKGKPNEEDARYHKHQGEDPHPTGSEAFQLSRTRRWRRGAGEATRILGETDDGEDDCLQEDNRTQLLDKTILTT